MRIPRAWWAVALALLALRLAVLVLSVSPAEPLGGDEPIYDEIARNLLAGRGYMYNEAPWVWKPPGWSLTLAGIYAVLGEGRRSVALAQGLFDSGTALLAGWLALRMFASRAAAALAFGLVLLWPPFFREARFAQTEPLFTLAVTATLAAGLRWARDPRARVAFALGACAGLSALVRPNGLIPMGAVLLGLFLLRPALRGAVVRAVPAVALGTLLVLVPWIARNALVFHAFIPVSTGGGELFYMGTTPETDGRWVPSKWWRLSGDVLGREEARLGRPVDPLERDRAFLRAGLANWERDPAGSLVIAVKRVFRLVFLPVGRPERVSLRWAFLAALLALYALALRQGLAGLRARDPAGAFAGVVLIVLLVSILTSSVFYTNSRYFEPMRPLVLVLVAGTLRAWGPFRALEGAPPAAPAG